MDNLFEEEHREISEVMNSYVLFYKLSDIEFEFEEEKLTSCIKLNTNFNNACVPISRMVIYLYNPAYEYLIDIRIRNHVINGHKMRKKLLKAGIKSYRKTDHSYGGNSYDIRFKTGAELHKILDCFSEYLPK